MGRSTSTRLGRSNRRTPKRCHRDLCLKGRIRKRTPLRKIPLPRRRHDAHLVLASPLQQPALQLGLESLPVGSRRGRASFRVPPSPAALLARHPDFLQLGQQQSAVSLDLTNGNPDAIGTTLNQGPALSRLYPRRSPRFSRHQPQQQQQQQQRISVPTVRYDDNDDDVVVLTEVAARGRRSRRSSSVSSAGRRKSARRRRLSSEEDEVTVLDHLSRPGTAGFSNGGNRESRMGGRPGRSCSPCFGNDRNMFVGDSRRSPKRGQLRPIVIDGQNVALEHGIAKGKGKRFSSLGVLLCVEFFQKRGHPEIVVFVPRFRRKASQADDPHLLELLHQRGILKYTPSRTVNGEHCNSHDDPFVLQYAAKFGGVIVSNDQYREFLDQDPAIKKAVDERLLNFVWVRDTFMLPQDPLGRRGPSLDRYLRY